MSKRILVAGIEESGKDTVLDLVLKGSKKNLPKFRYLKFGKFPRKVSSVNDIKKLQKNINKKINNVVDGRDNVVVSGSFAVKTSHGFVPLMTKDFFKTIDPDIFILMELETEPKDKLVRYEMMQTIRRRDIDMEDVKEHQYINRQHAISWSSSTGAPLKIIKVEHGNIKKAIRDVSDIIKFLLE